MFLQVIGWLTILILTLCASLAAFIFTGFRRIGGVDSPRDRVVAVVFIIVAGLLWWVIISTVPFSVVPAGG